MPPTLVHYASPNFWNCYNELPNEIQNLADEKFEYLKSNPQHPSLHFKKINGPYWAARVGLSYRALAMEVDAGFLWFWIGSHAEYNTLIQKL